MVSGEHRRGCSSYNQKHSLNTPTHQLPHSPYKPTRAQPRVQIKHAYGLSTCSHWEASVLQTQFPLVPHIRASGTVRHHSSHWGSAGR